MSDKPKKRTVVANPDLFGIIGNVREARELSRTDWAKLLQVSEETTRRWDRRKAVPDANTLRSIARLSEGTNASVSEPTLAWAAHLAALDRHRLTDDELAPEEAAAS